MAQEPKRRGEPLPLPPTPPARTAPRRMPRGKTEDEILNERRPMDPLARVPFQRSDDPGYIVDSEGMMAPRNFEYMNRAREKQKEPTRLKKGGPVKGGKWIQGAIKKPGALKAQLGVKAGQKIPAKKLASAAKAPGKLGQRARLAQTLGKMKKGK